MIQVESGWRCAGPWLSFKHYIVPFLQDGSVSDRPERNVTGVVMWTTPGSLTLDSNVHSEQECIQRKGGKVSEMHGNLSSYRSIPFDGRIDGHVLGSILVSRNQ